MRDEAERMIDRLVEDNARANAEAEETWAVLDAAGIDAQTDVTLAEAVQMLVAVRDVAIAHAEHAAVAAADAMAELARQRDGWKALADRYAGAFNAMTAALTTFLAGGSDD
jgi:hypothetical protein